MHAPHPPEHWQRLGAEAARMIDEVPAYAGRPAPPTDITPAAMSAWLSSLPTVKKRDLRRGFPKSMVRRTQDLKQAMAAAEVEIIATSGTSQDRLQILWEWTWWDPQEREAMRLSKRIAEHMPLLAADRAAFREAVLTTPVCGGATCHIGNLTREERTVDGMLFLNQVADPTHWRRAELDRMVAEWNELGPDGVEADPAYLAALARHVTATGGRLHTPAYVTLTYEQITHAARRAIGRVLDCPLLSLYGATEAGVLFMESEDGRLHHNARHSHIELLSEGADLYRIAVTTLGREWMPLLRYELGDVVRLAPGGDEAGPGYQLARIEGRLSDCLRTDGGLFTPAGLDDLVDEAEPAIEAWQLAEEPSGWRLRVVGSDGTKAAAALTAAVGRSITASREAAILPEGSGKYRLVRPAELGS